MGYIEEIEKHYQAMRAQATQLCSRAYSRQWYDMGVSPQDAAAWASSGHLPEEAALLIAQGITLEMAAAGDDALVAEHGVIGAAVLKLRLEHPGADILVDPDAEPDQS